MRFSVPLHPNMGAAVLTHVRRLVKLPERGFVAGQAVASALEDLYGAGGGVYNDVDVFIRAPRFTQPRERLVLLPSRFATEVTLQPAPGADYGHLPHQHTLVAAPTYTISGVRRTDLLNEVFYATDKVLGSLDSARCVLKSFDINAVRVGVDIASGELLWDLAFTQFAQTGELRLCALHTPYHSLVRLLRKHRELPNVTVNTEASASLVAVLSTPAIRRTIEKYNAATFWFGAKYAEQARAVKGELAPYFSLRSQHQYYDEIADKVRPGFGDETSAPYELSTLKRRGSPDVACSDHIGESLLDMLTLPAHIYAQFKGSARAGIVVPAAPWEAEALKQAPLAAQQQAFGPGYLAGWTGKAPAHTLANFLTPRHAVASQLQGLSAPAQLALFEGVNDYLKAAGVPDLDHVRDTGAQQQSLVDVASWIRGCEAVLAAERSYMLGRLSVPTALDEVVWADWPGAQVVLLSTERLLREWSAQHGWEVPTLLHSYLWIGVNMGRHPRDTSLLRFAVNRTSGFLGGRHGFETRARMPVVMQKDHKKLRVLLHGFARTAGWFRPK